MPYILAVGWFGPNTYIIMFCLFIIFEIRGSNILVGGMAMI